MFQLSLRIYHQIINMSIYFQNIVNTAACWLRDITAYCFIRLPGSLDQTGRPPGAGGLPLQVRGSAVAPQGDTGSS